MVPQDISLEIVHLWIVEGGIVCDLKVAEWMASSSSLFIGIDESTKSTKRSFLELGGQMCSTDPDLHIWCVTLTVQSKTEQEVVSLSVEKMLELIFDEFQLINEIQHDWGLQESRIYEIMTVTFDLTPANTSWLGVLGKKLKELCKAAWEEDKASGTISDWLGLVTDLPPLLIEKGCEDHLTALISTEFAKR